MAQRYTPGYSRDRSPPPRQPDRYEASRASRGGNELFRGRGRGYAGRGDFRPDLRDRDLIRDGRNSPPPTDNDRSLESRINPSWRDEREFERRRSPPPSRRGGGPPASDFRDFRDAHPPRDDGIGRGRGGFGRGGGPPFRDEGFAVRGRGRGGFIPRGRGGFDDRARRRESMADDRELFRARSRSPPPPPRADHWERPPPPREQREPVRHDEWRPPPRRDSDRVMEHGEINDRYRNERPPSAMGSRRTSAPSSRPATPHGPGPALNQSTSAPRQGQDTDRDQNLVRRVTSMTTPAPPRDLRREIQKPEYPASRIEASRGRYTSGASSPVQPPSVPAFGASQFRQISGTTPVEGPQYNIFQVPGNTSRSGGPVSPVTTRARVPPRSPSPALQPVQDPVRAPPTRPARQPSPGPILRIPKARSPEKQAPQQPTPVNRPPPPQAPKQVTQPSLGVQPGATRQPPREGPRDAPREIQRDPPRELTRETQRELPREQPREVQRELPREQPREPQREPVREAPRDIQRAPVRDASRDFSRESIRETPREPPREFSRPPTRDAPRDTPREPMREVQREPIREAQRPVPREQLRDVPRGAPQNSARGIPGEVPRQPARELAREAPREIPRQAPREVPRDIQRDTPHDRNAPRTIQREMPRDLPQPTQSTPAASRPVEPKTADASRPRSPAQSRPALAPAPAFNNAPFVNPARMSLIQSQSSSEDVTMQDAPSRYNPPASRPPQAPQAPLQQAPPQGPSRFLQPIARVPPSAPRAEVEKQAPKQPEADRSVPKGPKADRSQDSRSNFERRSQTFLVAPQNANRSDGPVSPMTRTSSLSGPASRPDMSQHSTQQLNMHKSPPLGPRQHPGFNAPQPPAAPRIETAPSGPSSMRVQTGATGTSPQPSPNFVAPSGPRSASALAHPSPNLTARAVTSTQFPSPNTSTTSIPSIPTGPRAGRGASQPPIRLQPPVPGPPGGWNQWSRPNMQGQQRGPVPIIPAKRDADGDEKAGGSQKNFIRADTVGAVELVRAPQSATPTSQGRAQSVGDASAAFRRNFPRRESPKPPPKPKSPPRPLSPAFPDAPLSPAFPGEYGDEDALMLDEQDAEKNEAEFQKNKGDLEAQKIDLSTRYLRGSSPLEKLAYLGRMAISEVVVEGEEALAATPELMEEAPLEPAQLLTPKTEEVEDDGTMIDGNEPPTPPIGSPELKALPFLKNAPMTPLSEQGIFNDNKRHTHAVTMLLQAELKRQEFDRIETERELSQQYAELYRPWQKYVDEMDRDKQEEGILGSDQTMGGMTAVASAALDPVATAAVVNENRRSRAAANATDYDMDRALQESLETAAIEAAKREKEALASRPDLDKEAELPRLLTEEEQRLRIFQDTSRKRDPSQALRVYALMPPVDEFTPAEHKIMVNRYKEFPKKFGTIAQSLPGRNFKECLNHYYTSKWTGEYKPPRDKRRRKGTARTRVSSTGMRNKTNALISNLDETRDEPAVTESGRPRRAAAPTFGEKEVEEAAPAPAPAPKSRAKIDPETGEKIKRPRAAPKEGRAPRRPKAVSQASARQLTMSPEKQRLDLPAGASDIMADMRQKELDVANGLTAMQAGRNYSTMDYPQAMMNDPGMNIDGYGAAVGSVKPGSRRKDDSSSYWSVSEKNAFASNFDRLGPDWVAISNAMGTKSAQMVPDPRRRCETKLDVLANMAQVKNYYNRSAKDKGPGLQNGSGDTREDIGQDMKLPAVNQRRRNEPTPVSASSALPQSSESTISPPKRLLEQAAQAQHYPPPPSSMYPTAVSRQHSRENLAISPQRPPSNTQAPPVEAISSYESLRGDVRPESRPSISSFLQQPGQAPQYGSLTHQPIPRPEMDDFRTRHEVQPSQQPSQSWQHRDYREEQRSYRDAGPPMGLLQHAAPQHGAPVSAYQEPPRQQYGRFDPVHDQRRVSVDHRLDDRRFLTDPRDARMLMSPQLNTRPTYGQDPGSFRQSIASTPPALTTTPQQSSSLFRGDERRYSMAPPALTSPQPAQAAPVRHEPRKTSNLSAILNAEPNDPPERRPMVRETESLRTVTPTQGSYPPAAPLSRPQSQAGMRDEYGVPRSQQPGLPAYGAPPQRADIEQREASVYNMGRSEWLPTSRTTYTPLPPTGAQPLPYQPPEGRVETRPPFDHRASLSGISSRYNPSPPPSVFQNQRESTSLRHPYQPHPAPPAPLQYHQQVPHQSSPQVRYQVPYNQQPPVQSVTSTPTLVPHQRQTSGTFSRPTEAEYHIRREREERERREHQYREEQQYQEREQQEQRQQHEQRQQQERMAASRPENGYFRAGSGQYPPPQQSGHQRTFSDGQYEPGHPGGQQGSVPPPAQRPQPQQQLSQGHVPQHQLPLSDSRSQQQQQEMARFGTVDNRVPPGPANNMPPSYGSRPGSTFGGGFGGYGQGPPPQVQQQQQGQPQGQGQVQPPPGQGHGERRRYE
jgi:serine/arginine repetitive matrix protein 2